MATPDLDAARTQATANDAAEQALDVAGSMHDTPDISDTSGATPAAVTFVSGTAKVVNQSQDTMLYINITTAAALAIATGPTSSVTTVLSVSQSSALGLMSIRVPQGWYVKLTGTMADVTCVQIPC